MPAHSNWAPYLGNIILYPVKQLPLIQQSRVQITIFLDFLASQETECPNTIVEVHEDEVIF